MPYQVEFTLEADTDLSRIKAFYRAEIFNAIENHLQYSPTQISRARIKRLRLLDSPTYRLRVGDFRVYYDVDEVTQMVTVLRVLSKEESQIYLRERGSGP